MEFLPRSTNFFVFSESLRDALGIDGRPAPPFAFLVPADAGMQVQFRGQALTFRVPEVESGPDWFRQVSLPLLPLLAAGFSPRGPLVRHVSAIVRVRVCAAAIIARGCRR